MVSRIAQAVDLIATYHPKTHLRLKHLARGIVVGEHVGVQGMWLSDARLVRLSTHHVMDPEIVPADLAATIAHECAHAWLPSRGIPSEPLLRHRVEAICYRQEAAFARTVPGAEALAEYYERRAIRTLEEGPEPYSDARERERTVRALKQLGAPRWVVWLVGRLAARGSA